MPLSQQLRKARYLLSWSIDQASELAGLPAAVIARAEVGDGAPDITLTDLVCLKTTLEGAGAIIGHDGTVRLVRRGWSRQAVHAEMLADMPMRRFMALAQRVDDDFVRKHSSLSRPTAEPSLSRAELIALREACGPAGRLKFPPISIIHTLWKHGYAAITLGGLQVTNRGLERLLRERSRTRFDA